MKTGTTSLPVLRLSLLTIVAITIHGYHFGSDDGAVYLPAILKAIHPGLFPYGAEFFESPARISLFPVIVAATARVSHLNIGWTVFCWHIATIFVFLLAAWQLAGVCFSSSRARWSAVLVSALTMTVPVAGTALVMMDPYVTARSASTPLAMLAMAAFLGGQRRLSIFWLAVTATIHLQMAASGMACLGILALPESWTAPLFNPHFASEGAALAAVPGGFAFTPASPGYRQSLAMRPFLFISQWAWYEWFGVAAPLALLIGMSRFQPRGVLPAFSRLCRALTMFGMLATLAAIVVVSGKDFENFLRLQPMRAFQLIYIVFFLFLGGLLGEYLPRSRTWVWAALFLPIAALMFSVQRSDYPSSRHIEWPQADPANPWLSAFTWVRDNTPEDAVFALDPGYIFLSGEDQHGFRAVAQRSVLTDYYKDSGVVSLFPQLAPEWEREQQAQQGWAHLRLAGFQQLARQYPVSWVVLQGPPMAGLDCPYSRQAITVCRIPGAEGLQQLLPAARLN